MEKNVSIILPVYKIAPALLRASVESLINQTYSNIQIILVDDGSPDDCGTICDEYAQTDNRIEAYHIYNSGVSVARNIGIEHATGKYICFVDPDDKLKEDCIEQIVRAADDLSCDILLFKNTDTCTNNTQYTLKTKLCGDKEIEKLIECTILQKNTDYNAGACWCKLYKREFIFKHNLRYVPGVVKAQDRLFVFDCYLHHPCVAEFDYIGYIYTINEDSICHKYNPNIITILENTANEFHKRIKNDSKYKSLEYGMLMMFMYEYYQLYFVHIENKMTIKERISELRILCKKEMYDEAIKKIKLQSVRKRCLVLCLLLRFKLYRFSLTIMKKMIN